MTRHDTDRVMERGVSSSRPLRLDPAMAAPSLHYPKASTLFSALA